MNGNEFNEDKHSPGGDHDASSDETAMPIGFGGMDEGDGFGDADAFSGIEEPGKRGLNNGAMLLIAVVAIAAVGLFSMRTLTRATAAGDVPNEAEQSIESFLSMLQSSTAKGGADPSYKIGAEEAAVLDVLNESYASRQVALTNVQRNPFIIFEESAKPDSPSRPHGPDPIIQKRQDRLKLFERAAGRLELRSVLMGPTPLATISGNIVQSGATVIADPEGVSFKVIRISNDGVVIVAEDAELGVRHETTLIIDHDRTRRSAPQRRSNPRGSVRP